MQRGIKFGFSEIRPERVRKIVFRVFCLIEEVTRVSYVPACSNNEIRWGKRTSIEELEKGFFIKGIRIDSSSDSPFGGSNDFILSSISDSENEYHFLERIGIFFEFLQRIQ